MLGRMEKEEGGAKSCVTAEKSIAAYGPDARVSLHPLQYPWFAPVKCFSISLGKRLALQCPASSDVRQCQISRHTLRLAIPLRPILG